MGKKSVEESVDLSPEKMEVISGLDEAEKEKIKSLLEAVKNGGNDKLPELGGKSLAISTSCHRAAES